MTDRSEELLDSVHSAGACLVDIRELAGKLVTLSAGEFEALLLRCVDDGDDRAVSRLLQACAFNVVKLDPDVLCRYIGVCVEVLDSAPCFALQDENADQPPLTARVLSFPIIRITLITPPIVHNDDASHRLPGRLRPFPNTAAAALAILGYPSPVTDASASGDSS